MARHMLAQYAVHQRLPAFSCRFGISNHLRAVAHGHALFLRSDLGRPRNALIGPMAFNCAGVSAWASGSLLAAAVMDLSSSSVGIRTAGRLDMFDLVFHLATIGSAKADDSSRSAQVHKCHAVQDLGSGGERDHARLLVIQPVIDPHP